MRNPKKVLASLVRSSWFMLTLAVLLFLCIIFEVRVLGTQLPDPTDLVALILFAARLARDLLPALGVMVALGFIGAEFVQAVYGLKTRGEGGGFVGRRLFGMLGFRPYITVKEGKSVTSSKDTLARAGGPGNLLIYNDSAVVLEKAGKLTKVVTQGFKQLDPFERIWDVVDLRPQRWVYDVNAMTKEGIPVTCQADVAFQIDDGGTSPSGNKPYPATEKAIFLAASRKWVREASRSEDEQVFDWARRAIIGVTEGALRSILATYMLDQLLGQAEINQGHYRAEILAKLDAELRKSFPDLGVKVTKVALGDIRVSDEISQNQIEAWQTLWQRWAREREAEGKAESLLYVEAAKAQAQADMIVAITQAFRSLTEAKAAVPSQLVLLRMFEVLKRATFDPQSGYLFLPTEIMRAWKLVQNLALGGQAALESGEDEE